MIESFSTDLCKISSPASVTSSLVLQKRIFQRCQLSSKPTKLFCGVERTEGHLGQCWFTLPGAVSPLLEIRALVNHKKKGEKNIPVSQKAHIKWNFHELLCNEKAKGCILSESVQNLGRRGGCYLMESYSSHTLNRKNWSWVHLRHIHPQNIFKFIEDFGIIEDSLHMYLLLLHLIQSTN